MNNYYLLDNPPLKFEELFINMWLWDQEKNVYHKIIKISKNNQSFMNSKNENIFFKKNNFFRWAKKEKDELSLSL